jgi:hypothetical protein
MRENDGENEKEKKLENFHIWNTTPRPWAGCTLDVSDWLDGGLAAGWIWGLEGPFVGTILGSSWRSLEIRSAGVHRWCRLRF